MVLRTLRRRTALALGLTLLAIAVGAVLLQRSGVGWRVVSTPSMGTAAPVGSLVVDVPVAAGALRRGDVVTFRPPTTQDTTYTHRIAAFVPGGLRTKGDINGDVDPWILPVDRVVGRVAAILPGVGWLVRAMPMLAVGAAATLLLTRFSRTDATRHALRTFGLSCTVSATCLVLRPFTGITPLGTTSGPAGTTVQVVSTGLLPVRFAAGHASVTLSSGQVGTLPLPAGSSRVVATTLLDLPPLGWLLLALVWLAPTVHSVLAGPRRPG